MIDKIPTLSNLSEEHKLKEKLIEEFVTLARELSEDVDPISFPGVNPESYAILKQEEEDFPEESSYSTPIDEIIAKCKQEGIKVFKGSNFESANVFILPFGSDNLEDSILPRHLDPADGALKRISELQKQLKNLV